MLAEDGSSFSRVVVSSRSRHTVQALRPGIFCSPCSPKIAFTSRARLLVLLPQTRLPISARRIGTDCRSLVLPCWLTVAANVSSSFIASSTSVAPSGKGRFGGPCNPQARASLGMLAQSAPSTMAVRAPLAVSVSLCGLRFPPQNRRQSKCGLARHATHAWHGNRNPPRYCANSEKPDMGVTLCGSAIRRAVTRDGRTACRSNPASRKHPTQRFRRNLPPLLRESRSKTATCGARKGGSAHEKSPQNAGFFVIGGGRTRTDDLGVMNPML